MKGQDKRDLTFDEWVAYVFDRPVPPDRPPGAAGESDDDWPEWYYCFDADDHELDWWEPDPPTLLTYLTRLFENPGFLLDRYSDAQVAQAFLYIAGFHSEYFRTVFESDSSEADLQRWVRSVSNVYRDIFAVRCTAHYGHLNSGEPPNPLNDICFMWWDIGGMEYAVFSGGYEHLVDPIFEVLEQTLQLPNIACQESAVHGLAHVKLSSDDEHKPRVREIIDRFLARADLTKELRAYAVRARDEFIA